MGAGGIKSPMGGMPVAQKPMQQAPFQGFAPGLKQSAPAQQMPPQNPMQQPQGGPMQGGKGGMPGGQSPAGMPTQEQFQSLPPWAQQFAQGHMKQQAGGKGGMPGAQPGGGVPSWGQNYATRTGLGSITPSGPVTTPASANLPTSIM